MSVIDEKGRRLDRFTQPSLPVRLGIAWLTNAILLWAVVAALHDASTRNVG